jgi:multiple sugar transport system permease protein
MRKKGNNTEFLPSAEDLISTPGAESAGTGSAGTGSAGAESPGAESAGAESAAAEAAGTESVAAESTGLAAISEADVTQMQADAHRAKRDFDMGAPKELSRKEKKALDLKAKQVRKKYHVSNWQIIRNYRQYSREERAHYRYVFGHRIAGVAWPIFRFIMLFGMAFVVLYPIMYMISTSIRPQAEMTDPSVMWIPKTVSLDNYIRVWNEVHIPDILKNTVMVNVICSVIQVVACSITGYGFARFQFRFKNLLFGLVILQIIVPVQIIIIPLYMQFRYFDPVGLMTLFTGDALNLIDNPIALYLQAFFSNGLRAGLFILLFRQFFRGLPKELEDAAHLDGCGPIGTFVRVMIPNALTNYLTVFIFSLVWYWNDTYLTGAFFPQNKTIALSLGDVWRTISASIHGTPQGLASQYTVWVEAACMFAILPILILYIFLQRYFIEGVERSGIVG